MKEDQKLELETVTLKKDGPSKMAINIREDIKEKKLGGIPRGFNDEILEDVT